jgi:enhancing lycopene biosynthesis protein 2
MLRPAVVLMTLASLSGCGTYQAASIVTLVSTGKSISDHGASLATGANCNLLKHLWTGEYICEVPPVYNQYPL